MIIETLHTPRTRLRLAKRLESAIKALGWDCRIDPMDLRPATGSWRTDISLDVYRWEGWVSIDRHDGAGFMRCSVNSWHTMTECARHGVDLIFDHSWSAEAFPMPQQGGVK